MDDDVKQVEMSEKKRISRGLLRGLIIGCILAVVFIVSLQVFLDRLDKRNDEKAKNLKKETLAIRSMDDNVTLSFSECAYEGIARFKGDPPYRDLRKNVACSSMKKFFEDEVFTSPYFLGTMEKLLRSSDDILLFKAASEKAIPSTGVAFFVVDGHFFMMQFRETGYTGYEKYRVDLSEMVLNVRTVVDAVSYLAFPVHYESDKCNVSVWDSTSFGYGSLLCFNSYDGLVKFYSAMDESLRFFDDANKTIYVRLFGHGDEECKYAAKLVDRSSSVEVSFCTVEMVQVQFENAFTKAN
jgi:hypothetical protein